MRKTLIFMAAVAAMVCGGTAEASAKVYDRDTAVAEAVEYAEDEEEITEQDVEELKKKAEQGDADAQYNLGLSYYTGLGVAQDYAEAVKWWRKAAEQGVAYAQNNLGTCYYNGEGVAQDYAEAAYWFHKAAEQGNAYGQYGLADLYYYKFYQQDKALELFKAAARQGHKEAQKTLITLGEEW